MKASSLIVLYILVCCICEYTSVDILSELKINNLDFEYGINFKYEGWLAHSFDRFYVVMKFVLPTMEDLNFPLIKFDYTCNYLNANIDRNHFPTQFILNFKNFCRKIIPFIDFYKQQIESCNCTAHEILTKEISLTLKIF